METNTNRWISVEHTANCSLRAARAEIVRRVATCAWENQRENLICHLYLQKTARPTRVIDVRHSPMDVCDPPLSARNKRPISFRNEHFSCYTFPSRTWSGKKQRLSVTSNNHALFETRRKQLYVTTLRRSSRKHNIICSCECLSSRPLMNSTYSCVNNWNRQLKRNRKCMYMYTISAYP